jgi:NADPH:quinone reductase-like Zn-dependent oxidoreductase
LASTASKTVKSWAAQSATASLAPFSIQRRDPLPDDVVIDILYCGICHTDIHMVRNEWNVGAARSDATGKLPGPISAAKGRKNGPRQIPARTSLRVGEGG